jgi:2-polyprenyl-3-methyl-5-hydroxy-6-metoxy-1,4-benzoquinol methylase
MKHKYNSEHSIETSHGMLIWCESCGFWHMHPYLPVQQVTNLYADHYIDPLKKRGIQDKIQRISTYIKQTNHRGTVSLLDIGCGFGDLLLEAQTQGMHVQGVEPSKHMSQHVKKQGIPVLEAMYQDVDPRKVGRFDVVNLSYILEHVSDPYSFLERILTNQLNPGGLLIVEVPNDFSPFQEAAVASLNIPRWWIKLPDHQNYFSHETLPTMLRRLGMDIWHQTTGFPIDIFLLMGDDYISQPDQGKDCHAKRVAFEDALDQHGFTTLRRELYDRLAEVGVGREVICYAQKPT